MPNTQFSMLQGRARARRQLANRPLASPHTHTAARVTAANHATQNPKYKKRNINYTYSLNGGNGIHHNSLHPAPSGPRLDSQHGDVKHLPDTPETLKLHVVLRKYQK